VRSVSEEYALLGHFEKSLVTQSLVEKDGRRFDVVACSDDSKIWFDISQISYSGTCAIIVGVLLLILLGLGGLVAALVWLLG
jgi:hypothetical protein